MKKVLLLGCGMVGRAMALDLAVKYRVIAADIDSLALQKLNGRENIECIEADLSDESVITELAKDSDIVLIAVPGFMGFKTLKSIIESGKNVVDISFFPEDALELDELAASKGVIALVDFGVAPGMSNFILGYHNSKIQVREFVCMVGGLPYVRELPFQYKAPFSPVDIIEEYMRPARLVEKGSIVNKEALSEPEYVFIKDIGTLEAFNTDGLRTLIKTMKIPEMREKTLRYPGYIDIIKLFKETGLFSDIPVRTSSGTVKPIDLTSRLLFEKWKLGENEKEFTVMTIEISGTENGSEVKHSYYMLDSYDSDTGISSMARTTGYTACAAINLLLDGLYKRPGINPPEYVGADEICFDYVFKYLEQRNIYYRKSFL